MSAEGAKSRPFRRSCGSENQVNPLKKELMDLAKQRKQHVMDGLAEDQTPPGAYSAGKDRTTGKVYYGESGPGAGHEQAVTTGGCWRC